MLSPESGDAGARLRAAASAQRDAVRAALLRRSSGLSVDGDSEMLQVRARARAARQQPQAGTLTLAHRPHNRRDHTAR